MGHKRLALEGEMARHQTIEKDKRLEHYLNLMLNYDINNQAKAEGITIGEMAKRYFIESYAKVKS